jgi:hypothetical protein
MAAGAEPAQWKGKAAGGGSLAHDVSNLPGVGRHLGSQPRAKTSMTTMRAPQRGHGQGATPGASGVVSGCCFGSAAGGSAEPIGTSTANGCALRFPATECVTD